MNTVIVSAPYEEVVADHQPCDQLMTRGSRVNLPRTSKGTPTLSQAPVGAINLPLYCSFTRGGNPVCTPRGTPSPNATVNSSVRTAVISAATRASMDSARKTELGVNNKRHRLDSMNRMMCSAVQQTANEMSQRGNQPVVVTGLRS